MTRLRPDDLAHGFATRAIHAGQAPDLLSGAVMTPIYQTSTYVQEGLGKHKGYEYARTQNPTREALERCVASLEEAPGFAFGSGLALDTVKKLLSAGDHMVSGNICGSSRRLMGESTSGRTVLRSLTWRSNRVAEAVTPATKMICETQRTR
jgi:cystathionine beta-lyase/cystathionine gamma-synthase